MTDHWFVFSVFDFGRFIIVNEEMVKYQKRHACSMNSATCSKINWPWIPQCHHNQSTAEPSDLSSLGLVSLFTFISDANWILTLMHLLLFSRITINLGPDPDINLIRPCPKAHAGACETHYHLSWPAAQCTILWSLNSRPEGHGGAWLVREFSLLRVSSCILLYLVVNVYIC